MAISHLLEAYSHILCLLDTRTYFLLLMIILMMLSLRAVATVLLYKNAANNTVATAKQSLSGIGWV